MITRRRNACFVFKFLNQRQYFNSVLNVKILKLKFFHLPIFNKDYVNMSVHGNQIGDIIYSNFTTENVLSKFQMEQNGKFPENIRNDYWIQHKKLV